MFRWDVGTYCLNLMIFLKKIPPPCIMMTLGHFVTHKKILSMSGIGFCFITKWQKFTHSPPPHPPKKKLPDSSTLAFLQKQKQREKKQAQKKQLKKKVHKIHMW